MIDITLPIPPSTNRIWRAFKTRMIKSAEYRSWIEQAGKELTANLPVQPQVNCHYVLELQLPARMVGDIGNREKALSDLFVSHGVISDDKLAWKITTIRDAQVAPKRCRVLISLYKASLESAGDVAQLPCDRVAEVTRDEAA